MKRTEEMIVEAIEKQGKSLDDLAVMCHFEQCCLNKLSKEFQEQIKSLENSDEKEELERLFPIISKRFSALEQVRDICSIISIVLERNEPSLILADWVANLKRDAQDRLG